jgi:hypothetical protein
MRPHLNRRAFLAVGVEELAGVVQRAADELVGVGEIDRLDAEWARRR